MCREDFIKRAVPNIINNMGEYRYSRNNSIIFPNGWVASIVNNSLYPEKNAKYSVGICDYNGYFNFSVLNQHGADNGCFYCNTEDEICNVLAIIEGL